MTSTASLSGYAVLTEARMVRTGVFSGVIQVHASKDGQVCAPPVAIIVPGQWQTADDACRAALDYATVMADDGALRTAIDVREAALHGI